MSLSNHHPVVCFGEVLWDVLPGGKMAGGAPVNVAYHLQKLGKSPAVISRIGSDTMGEELLAVFSKAHIDTSYFQWDKEFPTGKVFAEVRENNEMHYDIAKPAAWDYIRWGAGFAQLVRNAGYFVFGSLITRNKQSKNTLFKCLEAANTKVLDINMRQPFYNKKTVEELLLKADILKLNLAELELITGWFNTYSSDKDRIQLLKDRFSLNTIIVTKGGDGATLNIGDEFYNHPGYRVQVADTVGSGDSFLAAIISKFIERAPPEEALAFACALGALVTSKHGGCPAYQPADIHNISSPINSLSFSH